MPPYHPRLPILASKRRMTSGLCWPKIVLRAKGAGGAGRHKSVGAAERAECRYGRVRRERRAAEGAEGDRKSVVKGTRVSVRVDHGGSRIIQKKTDGLSRGDKEY